MDDNKMTLHYFDRIVSQQELQKRGVVSLGLAVVVIAIGFSLSIYGTGIIGMMLLVAGGFLAGVGASRLSDAKRIKTVFRG